MGRATFRFYGDLTDFLSDETYVKSVAFDDPPSVKDRIEACGVPHTEVDLIVVDGQPVDFSYRLGDGDRIGVYPVFRSLETGFSLRPAPPVGRFVVDVNLGKLARYLRLIGFDSVSDGALDDGDLAHIAAKDDRILLTKDRNLLKRRIVVHGYLVRAVNPADQLVEVVRRFRRAELMQPFARCMECNGDIVPVAKSEVDHLLEPLTREHYDDFRHCRNCGRIYWRGSHVARLHSLVDKVRSEAK